MPKKSRNKKAGVNVATGNVMQKMMQMMANMSVVPPASKPKRRNRRRKANAVNAEGMITLTRKELLGSVTTDSKDDYITKFNIKPSAFKFLSNLGNSFERSRWLKLSLVYKPAVSLTTSGLVTMGVDWDATSAYTKREQVAAYTPSSTFAVWQDTEKQPLILPPGKLQSRQWYNHHSATVGDWGPGILVVGVTGAKSLTVGDIYVSYTIQMMGTRA